LLTILTEPRNALVKQYKALLGYDGADLTFTDDALEAVADKAIARKTGARGLRAIMESVMLDVMYDIPSQSNVKKCMINAEVVEGDAKPILVFEDDARARAAR